MGWISIIQRRPEIPLGVAGILRNRWPEWIGTGGRNPPEWVAAMERNRWPESSGICICYFTDSYGRYIKRFYSELIVKKIGGFLGIWGCFLQVNSEN